MSKKLVAVISAVAVIAVCGYLLVPKVGNISDTVNIGENTAETDTAKTETKQKGYDNIEGVSLTSETEKGILKTEEGSGSETLTTGEIPASDYPYTGNTTSASIYINLVSKIAFKASAIKCDGSSVEVSSVHTTPNAMFAVELTTSNPATAEAISFNVDASQNTKKSLLKVGLRVGENAEIKAGGIYYLINGDHIYRYIHNVNRTVEIPAEFNGKVVIPFSSFVLTDGGSAVNRANIEGISIQYQSVEKAPVKKMIYSQFKYIFDEKEGAETYDSSKIVQTVVDKNGYPYYSSTFEVCDDLDTNKNITPVGKYTAVQGKAHDGRLTMKQTHIDNASGVLVSLPYSSAGYQAISVDVDNTENAGEQWLTFGLNSEEGPSYIGSEATLYMVDRNGSYIRYENKQNTTAVRIPGGFKGTVILPFSQFTVKETGEQVSKDDITGLFVILKYVSTSTTEKIYLDNMKMIVGGGDQGQVTEHNIKFSGYPTRTLSDFSALPGLGCWSGIETSSLSLSEGRLRIKLNHTSGAATVAINHGGDKTDAVAIMFTVDTSEVSSTVMLKPMLTTVSAQGSTDPGYAQMRTDAVYYLYKDGKYYSGTPGNERTVVIPGGGKYTVIIPFDDMTLSNGGNTLQPDNLTTSLYLQLQNVVSDSTKSLYIDDLKYVINETPKSGKIEVVPMGGGGYVIGILIHPLDNDIKYIRTDVGGVYKWDPDNNRWIQMSGYFEGNYKQYCTDGFAIDPKDKNILYICVGNGNGAGTPGIYKSTDQGKTWRILTYALFLGNSVHRECGECIMVDPNDSNTVYCGTRGNFLVSHDAGTTWSSISDVPGNYSYPDAPYGLRCVAIDERAVVNERSKYVYVSAYTKGIYRSTDGGETWSLIKNSPTTPKIIRVANDGTLYATSDDGMWKYKSGAWSDITPAGAKRSFNALAVDPENPQRVIMARAIVGDECMNLPIYYTQDGGTTWTTKGSDKRKIDKLAWWPEYYFSSDTAALIFNPHNTKEVWMTDWYGVWMTYNIDDSRVDWYSKVKGHEEAVTFCQVSLPSGPVKYILGTVDNGALYYTDIEEYPVKRGNGDCCDLKFCATQPNYVIQTNASSSIQLSTDYGVSYKSISVPGVSRINVCAMSATDPNNIVVLENGGVPWYTKNGGASWTRSSGAPSNTMTDKWNRQYILRSDGALGNTFYYSGNDGIYISQDGGATWSRTSTAVSGFATIQTVCGKENWVYANYSSSIYFSTDGGKNFTKLNTISSVDCFSFGVGRDVGTVALYAVGTVGSKTGLFISDDVGATWTLMQPMSNLSLYGGVTGDMQTYGKCYMVCGGLGAIVIYK